MQSDSQRFETTRDEFVARGNDAVEILVNDHQAIKGLLDQLTSSNGAQRRATVESLKGILTVHNATEENLVYPALAVVANEIIEPRKLYFETAEADMLLFQLDAIAKGIDDGDFAAKADKFSKALREHIEDEETSAFPHLRNKTDAASQQELTKSVREFRRKLHFDAVAAAL